MASEEEDDSKTYSVRFPLFAKSVSSTLFPAYGNVVADENHAGKKEVQTKTQLDWLENSSFKSQDADSIQQKHEQLIQRETQKVSDDEVSASDHDSSTKNKAKLDTEGSDQDSPEPQKKCKRKKKKHKHKHKHKKHKHDSHSPRDGQGSMTSSKHKRSPSPSTSLIQEGQEKRVKNTSVPAQISNKIFREDFSDMAPEHAFRIDRKADRNNLSYDSLYRMHISKHRQLGYSCLGSANPNDNWFSQHGKKLKSKELRYFGKRNVATVSKAEVTAVSKRQDQHADDDHGNEDASFIPVATSMEVKPKSEANPLGIYDNATELYLQGMALPPETSHNACGDDIIKEPGVQIRQRTAEFNKILHEEPSNIDKWLEFIEYQDESVMLTDDSLKADQKKQAANVIIDIKLSIMDRALEKNPASVALKLAQLELCRETWDAGKVAKEWKDFVFVNSHNPDVWQQYLMFVQTGFSMFTVSKQIKAYGKCLSMLNGFKEGSDKSHEAAANLESQMLTIFLQLCYFLKQSGHMEKAVTMFQAMLELNLFVPNALDQASFQEKLEFLEIFWNGDSARVGETGAKGWRHFVDYQGEEQVPCGPWLSREAEETMEENIIKDGEKRQQTWLEMESSRASRHWLPWRPDTSAGETEEDCEDPDRLVLFDDVSSCLFSLTSADSKLTLVTEFFEFIGVWGPCDFPSSHPVFERQHNFVFERLDQLSFDFQRHFLPQFSETILSSELLERFVNNVSCQIFPNLNPHSQNYLTLMAFELKVETWRKKVKTANAKELKNISKELKKFAKGLLKEEHNRNNLTLWDAYAQVEWEFGNAQEARKIMDTALTMNAPCTKVTDCSLQCMLCKLCRTYVELELGISRTKRTRERNMGAEIGSQDRALYVLVNMALEEPYSAPPGGQIVVNPTKMLKVGKNFKQNSEIFLDRICTQDIKGECDNDLKFANLQNTWIHWQICYMYFLFLTSGLDAAKDVTEKVAMRPAGHIELRKNPNGNTETGTLFEVAQERLMCAYISFLQWHVTQNTAPLHVLRDPLQRALQRYPENEQLLQMYVQLESRASIAGRLRRYFAKAAVKSSSPVPWLYAAVAEVQRQQKLQEYVRQGLEQLPASVQKVPVETGSSHHLRAWFEKAARHPSAKHCVLLWRLYMQFEVDQGNVEQARAVFYRSLQHCPWAKSLYTDAIQHFPDQLQQVVDLMTEKELRVRAPLEEVDLLMASKPSLQLTDTDPGLQLPVQV